MSFQFFYRYLFSKRAGSLIRTISRISIFGICVSIMALVVVLSVMNGFNGTIRNRLLAIEPHLVVQVSSLQNLKLNEKMSSLNQLKSDFENEAKSQSTVVINQDIIIRTVEGLFGGAIAKGMDIVELNNRLESIEKAGDSSRSHYQTGTSDIIITQSIEEYKKVDLKPGEVILGIELAQSLRVFEGDQLIIIPPETLLLPSGEMPRYEKVTVKSLLSTHVADVDSKMMFYDPTHTLKRYMNSPSRSADLEIRFSDPDLAMTYEKYFKNKGFETSNWKERNESLIFALDLERLAMSVFLGMAALITCFSIVTVLTLLITQKRQEVGSLLAMGMSRSKARALFSKVGILLSLTGMISGLGLGLLVCYILEIYPMPILPDIYYESAIPVKVDGGFVVIVAILCVIAALFCSIYPVLKNTRGLPVELLRRFKN